METLSMMNAVSVMEMVSEMMNVMVMGILI
jgi:hypothetical protein